MPSKDSQPSHHHGAGQQLDAKAAGVLGRGLRELLKMTEGLELTPAPVKEYPFPLTQMVYRQLPSAETIRSDVESRMDSDPVSVLGNALALLELYECNQPDVGEHLLAGMEFIRTVFRIKRSSGWMAMLGDGDRDELTRAVEAKWQFRFFPGPQRPTGAYVLLNMLARYAYVYGKMPFGDAHAMCHFIEEHAPGVLVCRGKMTDLECTLALAAMKIGVPAVVPSDYPFTLGRSVRCDELDAIVEAAGSFPNVRKLFDTPEMAILPDYCDPDNQQEKIAPAVTWGDTPESFYVLQKGRVENPEIVVTGTPTGPIGVRVTIDAEPMDALDCHYIEHRICGFLSMMKGVAVRYNGEQFALDLADGTDLDPACIGEVLSAAIRKEFPRIENIRAEVMFETEKLADLAPRIHQDKQTRESQIAQATEENAAQFYGCMSCSPFAPDHVCVLTPERPPMCGQPLGRIKTGALYAFDDKTNIHHAKMHQDMNCYRVIDKGNCIDPQLGEWEGVNTVVEKLSHGRTKRIQLHCLDDFPNTACSCFRLILFKTPVPAEGIGVMDAAYEGRSPDGRSWKDLHYSLAGKQAPGLAGAVPGYLTSPKFLIAHGGWDAVVWASPKVAAIMGDKLPGHVAIGP